MTYKLSPYENACFYENIKTANKRFFFYYAVETGGDNFQIDTLIRDPSNVVIHDKKMEQQDLSYVMVLSKSRSIVATLKYGALNKSRATIA
ncbi:hypothetical protein O9G_003412 [Rozella allomycis CSF55]|uniref:GOLD domain-containing protein n=1 Tax=Rozella allomycis (strain CSF55) TaxID=988480 RepID=A0A075AQ00_ROZAC|nr:hypothetical protein O9G_003412 [Rozella allomycis CSF55]|eukprot:EPZ32268.1 hypothetical protein O9G_003412 [Rozella allomycis CSF55]